MHIEYLDPYTLSWPDGVFPLGSDALALGDFATLRRGWRVCDLGTGSGALLLLLARRAPGLILSAIERGGHHRRPAEQASPGGAV